MSATETPTKTTDNREARRAGYNADERAEARESEPITLGGTVYHPVRRTAAVMRDVRAIGRSQGKIARQTARLQKQATAKFEAAAELELEQAEALEAEGEELIDQADALGDVATTLTFQMLSILVADNDGNHPTPEHLENTTDMLEAEAIAEYLMAEAEADTKTDPTPTTPVSTT